MNPALQAELDSNQRVFPVLRIDWQVRETTLRTNRFAPGGLVHPEVGALGTALQGGWQPINYGPGVRGSTLATARTSVRVADKSQELGRFLETYQPRGSAARITWAALDLVEADWETIFLGVIEDWQAKDGAVSLIMKTDERDLRAPAPRPQYTRAAWPTVNEPAIYGTTVQLVLGIHNSFRINQRGMVTAYNVKRDDSTATALNLYVASLGNLAEISNIYFDGVLQTIPFTVLRGVYGGIYQTLIALERDDAPDPEVVVSFDCVGPDTTGGTGSGTLINPMSQLRVFLEEYAFRDNQDGVYQGAHPLIEQASWAEVEAFFDARDAESAVILGGGGSRPLGLDVVEGFLNAYPFVKLWWTEQGQIAATVIDFTDSDPDADFWLEADKQSEPSSFSFEPGDRREVFNRVEVPYLFSDVDAQYLSEYEAHDVDSIEAPLNRSFPNPWTQARYDRI
jgi:hypothetical protein